MRILSVLVLLLAAGAACFGQTPSALESDAKGWKDILPPASFEGWTRQPFMTTNPLDAATQWKVDTATKTLVCECKGGHEWLRYDRELGDAILHVEFRFTPIESGTGYNSGIFVRNSADGVIYHQAQTGGPGSGWLFANTPVDGKPTRINLRSQLKADRVKAAGEWNVVEVRAVGPKITVWINGDVTSELPNSGALKGHVGFEAEGYRIEFRNIKLKEL
jgi:hypothetical protein